MLTLLIEGGVSLDAIRQRACNWAYQLGMREVIFESAEILAEYRFPILPKP